MLEVVVVLLGCGCSQSRVPDELVRPNLFVAFQVDAMKVSGRAVVELNITP